MAVINVIKLKKTSRLLFNTLSLVLLISIANVSDASNINIQKMPSNIQRAIASASQKGVQENDKKIHDWIGKSQYHNLASANQNPPAIADQLLDSDKCLNISDVYIRGISLLTPADLQTLTELNNQCFTTRDINRLIKQITLLYINKGYITTRVLLSPVDKQHRLALTVIEGKLESIEINGKTAKTKNINLAMLFPNMVNQPLNLRDIEQGLDQANRLHSNHVTVNIKPGNAFGTSILSLNNQVTKAWSVNTLVDNYGQDNSGKERASISYSLDNPLGLFDYLNIGATRTLQNQSLGFNQSYNLLYSIPYGNLSFTTFASYSDYGVHQQLPTYKAYLSGHSLQFGLKTDYVFFRDQQNIQTLYGQWIKKQSNNYFEHEKLSVSSVDYDAFELGINSLHKFLSSNLNMNFAVEKGLPELMIEQHKTLDPLTSLSNFTKIKTTINFNKVFLFKDNIYQLTHVFYGQYSFDDLPGTEALCLTDPSAIRGIVNTYLSSGSGGYLQSTLSANYQTNIGIFSPRVGMDIGSTYYHDSQHQADAAVGMSIGLNYAHNYAHKNVNLDMMANKGFLLNANQANHESWQFLAQLSVVI